MPISVFIFVVICSIILILTAYWLGKEQMEQYLDKIELQHIQELMEHRDRWAEEVLRSQDEINQIIARNHKASGKTFTVVDSSVIKTLQAKDSDLKFTNEHY